MEATHIEPEVLIPEVMDGSRSGPSRSQPMQIEIGRPARLIALSMMVIMALAALAVASVVVAAAVLVSAVVFIVGLVLRLGAALLRKAER